MNKPPATLDEVLELLELGEVTFLDSKWVGTSRISLYRAAITALVEAAMSEGFRVVVQTSGTFPAVCEVADTPDDENPAALMPDDPESL